jgi:hypothetical protein
VRGHEQRSRGDQSFHNERGFILQGGRASGAHRHRALGQHLEDGRMLSGVDGYGKPYAIKRPVRH